MVSSRRLFISCILFVSILPQVLWGKDLPLHGQVAMVWGASQGIGAAIAERLAAEGAVVYLMSRSEDKLKALVEKIQSQGGKAQYIVADIRQENDIDTATQSVLEQHKRIDILVQNVGIYPRMPLEKVTKDYYREVMDTNFYSGVYAIQAVLPAMKEARYGRILMISSTTGNVTGIPYQTIYSASKGAITGFIKTAALELAPYQITINSLEPGYVTTDGVSDLGEDYHAKIANSVPLGRMGYPSEVAAIAYFMVHPDATYTTGSTWRVDGGLTLPESHFLHVLPVDHQ